MATVAPGERLFLNCKWRDRRTGQEGYYSEPKSYGGSVWLDEEQRVNYFMWEEGNYSCDCNRGPFFTGLDDGEYSCSENRFVILSSSVTNANGELVEQNGYHDSEVELFSGDPQN